MIHTILLTRTGEPRTNAILTLTSEAPDAKAAFKQFHRACYRWLTTTKEGEAFESSTMGDFNIGDVMCNDATILNDDIFQCILQEEGVAITKVESAGYQLPYDRILCNEPDED